MDIIEIILFILPAYLANSIPVIFTGKTPMDFGRKFIDKRRLLGDGKTYRGFMAGIFMATVIYMPVSYFLGKYYLPELSFFDKVNLAFIMSVGALIGDLAGSFIKRRLNLDRGQPSWLMDQLFFLFTAIIFAIAAYPQTAMHIDAIAIIVLVISTFALHLLFNQLAYRLKLKSVPW